MGCLLWNRLLFLVLVSERENKFGFYPFMNSRKRTNKIDNTNVDTQTRPHLLRLDNTRINLEQNKCTEKSTKVQW